MSKSEHRKSGTVAGWWARSGVNRIVLIIGGLFLLLLVWQIAAPTLRARQRAAAPAVSGPVATATSASVAGPTAAAANPADVQPVALADIPGNIATGQPAPDFTVRTMGGDKFALRDHAGQPTIIMFSAAWCGTCLFEANNLAQVYTKYKDRGLNIIILDADPSDTDADVQRFREAAGNADYVWAFDDNYAVMRAYTVQSLDTTVLIDPSGKIVYYDQYPTPLEPLLQAVMAVLPAQ